MSPSSSISEAEVFVQIVQGPRNRHPILRTRDGISLRIPNPEAKLKSLNTPPKPSASNPNSPPYAASIKSTMPDCGQTLHPKPQTLNLDSRTHTTLSRNPKNASALAPEILAVLGNPRLPVNRQRLVFQPYVQGWGLGVGELLQTPGLQRAEREILFGDIDCQSILLESGDCRESGD